MSVGANSSAARARHTRVPDFFIIGAPKTGTTSLHSMLRRHPQIFMPKIKEPQYLASDLRPRRKHEKAPREVFYPKTLDDYLALFCSATPEQRVGEATPTYLWSTTAAQNIADMQPEARLIAILREPAAFLRSLHSSFLRGGNETEASLREAMSLEDARRAGREIPRSSHRPQLLQYSAHVRYVDQLRRYGARFSRDQILVLIYDDFRADNAGTVKNVLRFLEVDEHYPIAAEKLNVSPQSVSSQQARLMLDSLSKGSGPIVRSTRVAVKALSTQPMRRAARRGVDRIGGRRLLSAELPSTDEGFMRELRGRFKPEVEALSAFLDRDLVSLWGYEEIG